eukprot:g16163.t1
MPCLEQRLVPRNRRNDKKSKYSNSCARSGQCCASMPCLEQRLVATRRSQDKQSNINHRILKSARRRRKDKSKHKSELPPPCPVLKQRFVARIASNDKKNKNSNSCNEVRSRLQPPRLVEKFLELLHWTSKKRQHKRNSIPTLKAKINIARRRRKDKKQPCNIADSNTKVRSRLPLHALSRKTTNRAILQIAILKSG